MSRSIFVAAVLLGLAGCQKAVRFPAAPKGTKDKAEPKAIWGWIIPARSPADLPIRFVASDRPEWHSLPAFWNTSPPNGGGRATIHVGQSPLGVLAGLALLQADEAITIKVPRGLPDPTPLIPAANPPTLGKWRLGKKLFFDRVLAAGTTPYACADCHKPDKGFTEPTAISLEGTRNTLSLINVVYNREQFWDGRVRTLEEVLVHALDDELGAGTSRLKVLGSHRFGGIAMKIDKSTDYRNEFRLVFGIERVTQDAVAKALATYLRTILSGDSFYDRAREETERSKSASPTAEHFKLALNDETVKRLSAALPKSSTPPSRDELAESIARGQAAFLGAGRCALCHPPPLFTNYQFHNERIGDSDLSQTVSGRETGRFSILPIGLKDPSMRGAYRTPGLRNLSATGPYFHDGSRASFDIFVDFDGNLRGSDGSVMSIPPPNLPGSHHIIFNQAEGTAILLFLLALDGQPVDPMVANR
jgi:cytochrome c peroxidase